MSKHESPMIERYWRKVGGTIVEEFPVVSQTDTCGPRRVDAVILPNGETRRAHWKEISLEGQDVIVIQAKASRLGMYLMGQGVFSADLIRRFKPASIRSIALCTKRDSALEPLLDNDCYSEVEVVIDEGA